MSAAYQLLIATHQLNNQTRVKLISPIRGIYKIIEETNLSISVMVFHDIMKASEKYDEIIERDRETGEPQNSFLQETTASHQKSKTNQSDETT